MSPDSLARCLHSAGGGVCSCPVANSAGKISWKMLFSQQSCLRLLGSLPLPRRACSLERLLTEERWLCG